MVTQQEKRMNKNKVIIIAEAGVNHNGDFDKAIMLIDVAADSGADVVKFQTFNAETLVTQKASKANYQIKNVEEQNESQFDMLKKLEIPKNWYPKLIEHCKKKDIQFMSTGFDEESNDFLASLNLPFFKIPSGEITNKPYIDHLSKKDKNIILSTGMASMFEIKEALKIMKSNGLSKKQITVLHCNTEYPTPYMDVNLNAMKTMKKELDVDIGYSDHTLGIDVPIAAVALGAKIIEKHFTLNVNFPGPDHKASLNPEEFKKMVRGIRIVEIALGNYEKKPSLSEKKNIDLVRKSIHLKRNLNKEDTITFNDIIMLRPGDGISPMMLNEVIGKRLNKSLNKGHKLSTKDIK